MPRSRTALLVSLALHAVLLLALLSIKNDGDSARASTPRVIAVELVQLGGSADTHGERAVATDTEDAPETSVDVADAATPPPAPHVADSDESVRVTETAAEAVAAPVEAPAHDAVARAQIEEVALEAVRMPLPVLEPAATLEAARAAAVPEPETVAIDETQLSMLDDKAAEWAAHLAEQLEFESNVAWEDDGQAYTATFTRVPAQGSMALDEVVVTIDTERGGSRFSTQMRMQRLGFSSFAQFVDRWDPQVQIHDDDIGGRFHSNSEIYVTNSGGVQPTFHGKVTTASGINTSYSTRRVSRGKVFLGGLETRARRILLPKRFLPPSDGDAGRARVQRFDGDTHITFYADGSYGWRGVQSAAREQRAALPDEPYYLLARQDAALYVRGVVNGEVLVYSPAKIVIEGNLVYASDPTLPNADDYLGLVSDNNVEIADPDTTGPGDLTVHAAIYAKRRFVVRHYTAGGHATLSVLGSVTAGALSATEPRFRTKLTFDERLERTRPPGFPMTDRYEVADRRGRWTVESPALD